MPKQALRNNRLLAALLVLIVLAASPARAQTLTQDTPLTFGRVVMHNNNAMRDLRLLSNGSYAADPGYYVYGGEEPQLGRYTIQNQVANTPMIITFDLTSATLTGGGLGTFSIVNPFTVPAVVVTDPSGNATFYVGATLRSNGNGMPFDNSNYSATFSITVTPDL